MGPDEPVPAGGSKLNKNLLKRDYFLSSDCVRIEFGSTEPVLIDFPRIFTIPSDTLSQHRKARSWYIVLNSRHHASPYCCSLSRGRHCYDDGEQLFAPWWARDTSSDHCLFLIYCFPAGCPSCLCWGILRYLPRRVASLGRLLYFVGMYYLPRRK